MFTRTRTIGSILFGLLFCSMSAWAGPSILQGLVSDANGRPLQGANIRIEAKNGSNLSKTIKTDAKGNYVSEPLPVGNYQVTLLVNGVVKATIKTETIKAGEATKLNFSLKAVAVGATKKPTHMVWIPAETGSNLGGHWVEVDANGNAPTAGADHVERVSGDGISVMQRTSGH